MVRIHVMALTRFFLYLLYLCVFSVAMEGERPTPREAPLLVPHFLMRHESKSPRETLQRAKSLVPHSRMIRESRSPRKTLQRAKSLMPHSLRRGESKSPHKTLQRGTSPMLPCHMPSAAKC